jgi:ribonucleoside-diphosphate reductase alpha chain
MDLGSYRQAPYEECDEETYNKLKAVVPEMVDWENFKEYDDNVEGAQMLSCTAAGGCEI